MAKIIKPNFGSNKDNNVSKENNNVVNDDGRMAVKLELFLNEREREIISNIQKENLLEELNSFPPVYEGDMDIVGVYVFDMGDFWETKVFFRNGADYPVNFEKVRLAIRNSKKEILASQLFDLSDIGDLPSHGAAPYKLNFYKENINVKNIPLNDWKIGFDGKVTTKKYKNFELEGFPDNFSEENLSILNKFLNGLPKVEQGNVDISKFSIGINTDGKIIIYLVARNAFKLPLTIGKLPVTVKNEEGNIIFSAMFDLQDVKISAEKARLLTLTGDTGIHPDKDMDLNNCIVEFRI